MDLGYSVRNDKRSGRIKICSDGPFLVIKSGLAHPIRSYYGSCEGQCSADVIEGRRKCENAENQIVGVFLDGVFEGSIESETFLDFLYKKGGTEVMLSETINCLYFQLLKCGYFRRKDEKKASNPAFDRR